MHIVKETTHIEERTFYDHLLVSAISPMIGNIIYTVAVERRILWLGIIGRLFVGLFASDVKNKQLVVAYSGPYNIVEEMAMVKKIQLFSTFIALLAGSMFGIKENCIFIYRHEVTISFETLPGIIMFALWMTQIAALLLSPYPTKQPIEETSSIDNESDIVTSASEQDEVKSQQSQTQRYTRHSRSNSDQSKLESYMKRLRRSFSEDSNRVTNDKKIRQQKQEDQMLEKSRKEISPALKQSLQNIAFPLSLMLYAFAKMTITTVSFH